MNNLIFHCLLIIAFLLSTQSKSREIRNKFENIEDYVIDKNDKSEFADVLREIENYRSIEQTLKQSIQKLNSDESKPKTEEERKSEKERSDQVRLLACIKLARQRTIQDERNFNTLVKIISDRIKLNEGKSSKTLAKMMLLNCFQLITLSEGNEIKYTPDLELKSMLYRHLIDFDKWREIFNSGSLKEISLIFESLKLGNLVDDKESREVKLSSKDMKNLEHMNKEIDGGHHDNRETNIILLGFNISEISTTYKYFLAIVMILSLGFLLLYLYYKIANLKRAYELTKKNQ